MILRRALRVLLAVALLAAWQSALVHPVAHVDEHGGLVHVAGVLGGHDSEDEDAGALCDAIAAVAACVAGAAADPFLGLEGNFGPSQGRDGGTHSAPALAYRSQAPPQFS